MSAFSDPLLRPNLNAAVVDYEAKLRREEAASKAKAKSDKDKADLNKQRYVFCARFFFLHMTTFVIISSHNKFFSSYKTIAKNPNGMFRFVYPPPDGKKNPSRPPDHALLFLFANTTEKNICITIFQRITSKEKGGCKSTCIERRTKGLSNPFKKQGSKLKRKKERRSTKKVPTVDTNASVDELCNRDE